MDTLIIKNALINALSLINSELESVCVDGLQEEYLQVIAQIENALLELDKK